MLKSQFLGSGIFGQTLANLPNKSPNVNQIELTSFTPNFSLSQITIKHMPSIPYSN